MLQFITFAIIYGILMYIWTFVYINKSHNKINQTFLIFLSVLLLWMILSVGNTYNESSVLGFIVKNVYFLCMFNMSLTFLLFIYRLIKRKQDIVFYIVVAVNTLTIIIRYLLPIDFFDPTFWRYTDPVIAPMMSATFSFPVAFAIFLIIHEYRITKDSRLKAQLKNISLGIGIACFISVISEYILPTWFQINTHLSLMYLAILILILIVFFSIMKYRFLNMQTDYIYRKLFLHSSDGIIIINKDDRVVCINEVAKEILQDENLDSGDKIKDYIKEYDFGTNYRQQELIISSDGSDRYISLSQHSIDAEDKDSAKLLIITDITSIKQILQREKDILIEKSSTDLLTGLYNKQYLIDNYYGDAMGGKIFSLLFIDIDNFKSVNDIYGHIAGDKVLQSLALCISGNIGDAAKAFRFGGDEFLVILEDVESSEAYRVSESIRKSANTLVFSQFDAGLKLSLSIGLVQGSAPAKDLILKADMAMYISKSEGKNRTTIFSESTLPGV
jgi:diguanylate cyclase (GGDEF)-like protein